MSEFTKVSSVADVAPGSGTTISLNDKEIALFNVGGTIFALDNTCLHQGGPLGEGTLEDKIVTCPWHGWQYDVTSGCNTFNPDVKVNCYRVKIENGDILVSE